MPQLQLWRGQRVFLVTVISRVTTVQSAKQTSESRPHWSSNYPKARRHPRSVLKPALERRSVKLMRFAELLIFTSLLALGAIVMSGCTYTTKPSELPPIPPELLEPPLSLRESSSSDDVLQAHLDNMQACSINAIRLQELIKVINKREALQD